MVATSRRRPLLPELLAEFNVRQLRLAARLAFGSGFAGGNINRADLCAGLNRACDDEKIHRAVCNHLLDQFQTSSHLRGWLSNLKSRGLPVEPSKAWGGKTRNAMKDYFIRVAYVGPSGPCRIASSKLLAKALRISYLWNQPQPLWGWSPLHRLLA